MYRFAFLLLAAIAFLVASATTHAADEKPFLAGAAASNITPWLGGGLVGNFGTPPPAKYVHDELHARCFVLDDGTTRITLVVSDNIYISREVLDDAKQQVTEATGLPPDRMLMSCTHTHSSVSARWKNPLQPEKEFDEAGHRVVQPVRRTGPGQDEPGEQPQVAEASRARRSPDRVSRDRDARRLS